jgi:hypothetical protein
MPAVEQLTFTKVRQSVPEAIFHRFVLFYFKTELKFFLLEICVPTDEGVNGKSSRTCLA